MVLDVARAGRRLGGFAGSSGCGGSAAVRHAFAGLGRSRFFHGGGGFGRLGDRGRAATDGRYGSGCRTRCRSGGGGRSILRYSVAAGAGVARRSGRRHVEFLLKTRDRIPGRPCAESTKRARDRRPVRRSTALPCLTTP